MKPKKIEKSFKGVLARDGAFFWEKNQKET
jgi:hypothetical protein